MSEHSENPIYDYLRRLMSEYNISDFYFRAEMPLAVRLDGEIRVLNDTIISEAQLDALFRHELDDEAYAQFCISNDIDFALTIDARRFRANGYRVISGWAMVLRPIANSIPNITDLGLPIAAHTILNETSGLVLVTGATGSGKSTSLAAMINKINQTRASHIITIEDPIEFIHTPQKAIISQRETGRHTHTFASALKGALRQNPDIILLGELRDYETISLALTAAETGHLVFGTLHTSGAAETVNRIVDAFPAEEQTQARAQLSQSLKLVMTQKLIKAKTGGRIGAFEIMLCIPAIRNLIRENKIAQINSAIQTGAQHGMFTMDKYVSGLVEKGFID